MGRRRRRRGGVRRDVPRDCDEPVDVCARPPRRRRRRPAALGVAANVSYPGGASPIDIVFDPVTLAFNATATHALPTLMASYHSAALSDATAGGYSLSAAAHPLPRTKRETAIRSAFLGIFASIIILIPFAFVAASFVAPLVRERESGSKQLQLVSGTPGVLYWLANWSWDLVVYAAVEGATLLVFIAMNRPSLWATPGVRRDGGAARAVRRRPRAVVGAVVRVRAEHRADRADRALLPLGLWAHRRPDHGRDRPPRRQSLRTYLYPLFPAYCLGRGFFVVDAIAIAVHRAAAAVPDSRHGVSSRRDRRVRRPHPAAPQLGARLGLACRRKPARPSSRRRPSALVRPSSSFSTASSKTPRCVPSDAVELHHRAAAAAAAAAAPPPGFCPQYTPRGLPGSGAGAGGGGVGRATAARWCCGGKNLASPSRPLPPHRGRRVLASSASTAPASATRMLTGALAPTSGDALLPHILDGQASIRKLVGSPAARRPPELMTGREHLRPTPLKGVPAARSRPKARLIVELDLALTPTSRRAVPGQQGSLRRPRTIGGPQARRPLRPPLPHPPPLRPSPSPPPSSSYSSCCSTSPPGMDAARSVSVGVIRRRTADCCTILTTHSMEARAAPHAAPHHPATPRIHPAARSPPRLPRPSQSARPLLASASRSTARSPASAPSRRRRPARPRRLTPPHASPHPPPPPPSGAKVAGPGHKVDLRLDGAATGTATAATAAALASQRRRGAALEEDEPPTAAIPVPREDADLPRLFDHLAGARRAGRAR